MEALRVVRDEHLVDNAFKMGEIFREGICAMKSPIVGEVRGKGLLNAVTIVPQDGKTAWDVCMAMKDRGLLAKPTHGHIIRFTPPLVITESQMRSALEIIGSVLV